MCPCKITSLTAPATRDRCQVVLVFNIDSGSGDGVDVSGLGVAIVADPPRMMTDGNWNVGLSLDDRASEEQVDALLGVYSGRLADRWRHWPRWLAGCSASSGRGSSTATTADGTRRGSATA